VPRGLAALIVASVPIWMTVIDGSSAANGDGVLILARARLGGIGVSLAPGNSRAAATSTPLGAAALLTAALLWASDRCTPAGGAADLDAARDAMR